jgi:hypothetical protein
LEDEFTTHTYTLRDGRVIYSKGNDHIIDAASGGFLLAPWGKKPIRNVRQHLGQAGEETVMLKPVLTNPVFI